MIKSLFKKFRLWILLLLFLLTACGDSGKNTGEIRHLKISPGSRIATLDPALAADTASQYMVAAFYDMPLQYSYTERPYRLEPAMLEKLPELSADKRIFRCTLKKGLLFQNDPCFPDRASREVTAADMVFSILRLADPHVRSTGYWLIRNKIKGIGEFRSRAGTSAQGDHTIYEQGCSGLRIIDRYTFEIELEHPDPRFSYALAMPYFAAVSRKAALYYGEKLSDHPVGSGPFCLTEWVKDYVIRLKRYGEYREEYFTAATEPGDRQRRLPLLDEITCYLVKQPLASWLMFLQGELDYCALSGENFDAIVNEKKQLSGVLTGRGIKLHSAPEFQINYIGFHFADPVLSRNPALRQAISLAFDKDLRSTVTNGRLQPVYGPLPPGIKGYEESFRGKFGQKNLEKARERMRQAGYPDGIDPKTGEALTLTFDQAGSDTFYRQTAELLSADLAKIGIKLRPEFNNRARFFRNSPGDKLNCSVFHGQEITRMQKTFSNFSMDRMQKAATV